MILKAANGRLYNGAHKQIILTGNRPDEYAVRVRQEVPDGLLDYCKVMREMSETTSSDTGYTVARVTKAHVINWMLDGFDPFASEDESIEDADRRHREIQRRLIAENNEKFLCTNKRI